jgi:hypothetical protein
MADEKVVALNDLFNQPEKFPDLVEANSDEAVAPTAPDEIDPAPTAKEGAEEQPVASPELLDPLATENLRNESGTEPLSNEAGNFEAAKFRLRKLLEMKEYAMLTLLEHHLDTLALQASAPPLPEGAVRVQTIDKRIIELLRAAKQDHKSKSCGPIKPKHGRFRPTLLYDHQRRVAPSKVVEDAVPLCYVREGEVTDDKLEDDYIAVLDRKHGSEVEASIQEPQPRGVTLKEEADRLRLRLTITKALDATVEDCSHCGKPIPADKRRSTVLRIDHINLEEIGVIKRIAVHCEKCRDVDATILESGPWLADLTADELQAYKLKRQRLNQTEIGEAMSPKRSQETVSRILKNVEQKRTAAMMATFRRTGGA